MIERRDRRPPVTYTTFSARDLGGDTAELFKTAARNAYDRFRPQAMIVGASCTGSLIQDDPGGLARALNLPVPVVTVDLPAYQRKENWGAAETLYQLVRALAGPSAPAPGTRRAERATGARPCCNLLGPTALGFRHRDDITEVTSLLAKLGVDVNVTAPMLQQDHEISGILHALDGKFVRPAPGGDLLRTPTVLPTGRNIHGFDPFRIPSAFAVQDGTQQAQRLIEAHERKYWSPDPEMLDVLRRAGEELEDRLEGVGVAA